VVAPEQVAPGVWRSGTRYVNWYVVDGGQAGLTLVDCGLPGYWRGLVAALGKLGRTPDAVAGVVLTHGHIDHVGTAARLAAAGAGVHLHPADWGLARDPSTNRTDRSLVPYLGWPATAAFVGHCLLNGALRPAKFPQPTPLEDGRTLGVPGEPRVVHVPGHTDGSCALEFPDHGVAFLGDALCTASPVTGRRVSPQVQTRASNTDSEQAMSSLANLRGLTSRVLLPGHGEPWRDGAEEAIRSAQAVGCR
jgi:glyoxylase-like metal-dependent hydrolase (beta-lactamase superfamily II)